MKSIQRKTTFITIYLRNRVYGNAVKQYTCIISKNHNFSLSSNRCFIFLKITRAASSKLILTVMVGETVQTDRN